MNDINWGSWNWSRWDWLDKSESVWDKSLINPDNSCLFDFSNPDSISHPNIHKSSTGDKVLDFSGIYRAALAGTNSKQYAPYFTIVAAGESLFVPYSESSSTIKDGDPKLGAALNDPNGVWQMTGLGTIVGSDPISGNKANYIDLICKADISICDKLSDEAEKTKCKNSKLNDKYTTYFADLKNPCCCAKLAKFWMDNNDPMVGQSVFPLWKCSSFMGWKISMSKKCISNCSWWNNTII